MENRQHMDVNCNQWKTKTWDVGVTIPQWKRKIAAGRMRVVDYISSRILAKLICSLALPILDDPFMCANSLRLLFCSTHVSLSRKNIIIYFLYIRVLRCSARNWKVAQLEIERFYVGQYFYKWNHPINENVLGWKKTSFLNVFFSFLIYFHSVECISNFSHKYEGIIWRQ